MLERSFADQKDFLVASLSEMNSYFVHEEESQQGHLQSSGHQGLCLYRTFDKLDDIFDLNYDLDKDLVVDHNIEERLYEGAGVGVQSGYSTILLALHSINLKKNDKFVDLGSGYGRVGLVCSLLRPDVEFIGYEYVPHRVEVSNQSSVSLGLDKNLQFKEQDLSLKSFKIPVADVYYLYDPFSKETYNYVLEQIVEISKKKEIIIVSKGNSRNWLIDIAKEESWTEPVLIHNGNLCIFRSNQIE